MESKQAGYFERGGGQERKASMQVEELCKQCGRCVKSRACCPAGCHHALRCAALHWPGGASPQRQ